MRHPAMQGKRDANEPQIIEALQLHGAAVLPLIIGSGVPDLLVCYRGELFLLEVKTENGRLNKKQMKWIGEWPGKVYVVRSPVDALKAVGAIETPLDERARLAGVGA